MALSFICVMVIHVSHSMGAMVSELLEFRHFLD